MGKKHTCLYGKKCKACRFPSSPMRMSKAAWPIWSDRMGVHPDQIPEAIAEGKRLGYSLEYNNAGQLRVDSLHMQRDYGRKIGLTDISKKEITMPKFRTMRERSIDNPPHR